MINFYFVVMGKIDASIIAIKKFICDGIRNEFIKLETLIIKQQGIKTMNIA